MEAAAVVVAAGAGARLGGPIPKQFLEVAGEPILLRAVRPFLEHPRVGAVVVVLPPLDAARPPHFLAGLAIRIVAGGAERGDSVWNGLLATPEQAERVLIHDGARPFVTAPVIDRVLDAARRGGALAALPVTDTIKEVDTDGTVAATLERTRLWQAQTPQGFPRGEILAAYHRARQEGVAATDDAALYERYVGPVKVVLGSELNLKITRPLDLEVAAAVAAHLAGRVQFPPG
ncbi:MAG TPA: 2-C-methyl-D-erythritol 4-phosphate cytidylyltransferase [Longimicrobiaceae bacterium]|nr:2-C-methyl-D-erythritol 4-phosphate cytidylyltransferase [Longimicrobiaceae bacterium]